MDQFTFALIAMFGVPFTGVALLFLAHRLTPERIWKSFSVQTIVTGSFLALLATPFLVAHADAQGEYYDGPEELVRATFALPQGVQVNHQRDRTSRYGDCWRHAVNWRSDVIFPSSEAFDDWYARDDYREAFIDQVVGYFGVNPSHVGVAEGAFEMRERDPEYVLVDDHKAYSRNVRILEFYEPFVCTAIERDEAGTITLRPCDPIARPVDMGSEGWIIINPSAKDRTLEGRILFLSGPHYCTNPIRKRVNTALGLDHPEGGEPNLAIGQILPSP